MSAAHLFYIIRFVCLCNEAFDCLLLLSCLVGALMLTVISFVKLSWPQNLTKNNKTHTEKETQNTNEMTKMTNHKIKTE